MEGRISDLNLERYELDVQAILDNINELAEDGETLEVYQAHKRWDWWFAKPSSVSDLKYHLECAVSLLNSLQFKQL